MSVTTIKDIAERTNLSIGTVSIVLNGRGDEMRISKKTQQRIIEAAQGLGYLPNVSARRLRQSNARNMPVIAIFWPSDLSADLLGRFIMGAQSCVLAQEAEFEMTIHPYKRNDTERIRDICGGGGYHGAILTGLSADEQDELEKDKLTVPTVLFNRMSNIYSCAYVDTYEIGRRSAELFASRGHQRVGTIVPDYPIDTMKNLRFKGFVEACAKYGLQLEPHHIQAAPMTMAGGNAATKRILESGEPLPTAMYYPLGPMAVAALPEFYRAGVAIPEQMEILTYGDHDAESYSVPSLSTVKLPVEEMAEGCIRLVMARVLDTSAKPTAVPFETPFVFRESCGGFGDMR